MPTARSSISDAEVALREAMLASDVARLEALVADDVVFVDQRGKAADLALHASGELALDRVDLSEQQMLPLPAGGAGVIVCADIAGRYAGNPLAGAFRYTRVRVARDGRLQVRAAQCTTIAG